MAAIASLAAVFAAGVTSVLAGLLPGWRSRREDRRDVAAVLAAHHVTDGRPTLADRLAAAVRGRRAER